VGLALLAGLLIFASQKEEIKNIINNGGGSFVEKEQQLAQLKSYKVIYNDIYPKLRIARTEILSSKAKKSEAEISAMSKENMDKLSDMEILHAAEMTPDLTEKENIYLAAIKKNDTYAAHTNLAGVYIEKSLKASSEDEKAKLLENAMMHLETANRIQESAEANHNIGVISLIKGDIAKGMEYIQKASSMVSDDASQKVMNGVKGALEIRAGKYDAAVASLSNSAQTSDNAFNKGLAYVLKKDYTKAKTALKEAAELNANDAWIYYVSAIAAARMNEKSEVIAMLNKAVSMNADLKQKFVEDLEFKNFWNDTEVRDAVK
jgi:tetratricopeptide (TPR) repeat protein